MRRCPVTDEGVWLRALLLIRADAMRRCPTTARSQTGRLRKPRRARAGPPRAAATAAAAQTTSGMRRASRSTWRVSSCAPRV